MNRYRAVGLIDNLDNIEEFVLREGYAAESARYMQAVGGNTGNLAFVYGARQCIADSIVRIGWGWSTDRVREKVDAIVISCANQIGKHADLSGWADAIARFDLPVVLIGLGAQTPNYESEIEIPDGTLRFLDEVNKRRPGAGPNIAVRGEYTKGVLKGIGVESEAIGCPSLFISPDRQLGKHIAERASNQRIERVAVASGNPFHVENRKIEATMVSLCERYGGAYVVQHPEAMVSLALDETQLPETKASTIASALGFNGTADCRSWFRRNAYSFHDSQTWMHFLRHYDATIGARYHGVAFSVQAGVQGLVLHIDNRTSELSSTTGIPSIPVSEAPDYSLAQLVELARWDEGQGIEFDLNRVNRAEWMIRFLYENGINPARKLQGLAGYE